MIKFKPGDLVICRIHGPGVVLGSILNDCSHPLMVSFGKHYDIYTEDGRMFFRDEPVYLRLMSPLEEELL